MTKKNSGKSISVKRNPLFQQETPLSFDNVDSEDLIALTPEQEQDGFMSKWIQAVDPYDTFPKVFRRGERSGDRVLRDVKLYYKKFVLEDNWSEKKYVMVINTIFENRGVLHAYNLEKMGSLFDDEKLPVQIRLKRDEEGGKR